MNPPHTALLSAADLRCWPVMTLSYVTDEASCMSPSGPAACGDPAFLHGGRGNLYVATGMSWSQGLVMQENLLGTNHAHFCSPPEKGRRGTF